MAMNEIGNNNPTSAGVGSLSDRVRSLRLQESSESGGSRFSWVPWIICAVLALASGLLAMEAFSPIDDETLKKMAEDRQLTLSADGANKADLMTDAGVRETE